ncbi:unnamed protein product [Rhizoctonia solani]|uniref:A-kinase anchor protein 7-like phosphoesterase domain-containing protein n=1 Tax=Rhizoctonia solani TaxID=456999 RepID=A0A8H3DN15_9AGAM|nr:unnamed protein product [Rhizoctonia solani]
MSEVAVHAGSNLGRRGNRGGPRRAWRGRGAPGRPPQDRERPTHFISVPLDHLSHFTSQVSHFTDSLLAASPPINGLDPSIVISPSRLHLTLGVMNLASEDQLSNEPRVNSPHDQESGGERKAPRKSVADAVALLDSLKLDIESSLRGQPLQLCLNEFAVMRRSPAGEADVMYIGPATIGTKTAEHERSVGILETINRRFTEEGFITETRPLKGWAAPPVFNGPDRGYDIPKSALHWDATLIR